MLKNFIPNYSANKIYDTGVDLVSTRTFEFTAPTGEKVKVISIDDYRSLCIKLGVDPKLLLGE